MLLLLVLTPICLHSTESFDIVLRGNGFTIGRNQDVVCSFIVNQQTFSKWWKSLVVTHIAHYPKHSTCLWSASVGSNSIQHGSDIIYSLWTAKNKNKSGVA